MVSQRNRRIHSATMELPFFLILLVIGTSALNRNPEENVGVSNSNLFQGDMILSTSQRLAIKLGLDLNGGGISRGAVANRFLLWPNGILPYAIDPRLVLVIRAIKDAMQLWSSKTCITFKPRTTEINYVYFTLGTECSSFVGCQGGKQPINLGYGCWSKGTIAHEIGHTLGFHHEQSRPDRDTYVTINWNNILPPFRQHFWKYTTWRIQSLGVSYDYDSVMHFGSHFFSMNNKPTVVPTQLGKVIGQRVGPSFLDTYQMNLLYQCPCRDTYEFCRNYDCSNPLYHWLRPYCKSSCSLC